MKRKIIVSVVLCLFAGLTVFNVGLAHRYDNTDTTLDLISVMAKAFDEGEGSGGGPVWHKRDKDCSLNGTFTFDLEGDADLLALWGITIGGGQVSGTITITLDITLSGYAYDCGYGIPPDPNFYVPCPENGESQDCPSLPGGGSA